MLVKSAELWAAENHEYLYLWDVGHLDERAAAEVFQRTLADGEPQMCIRDSPDGIHVMKKSQYSGMFGDYSSYSEEYEEISDATFDPEEEQEGSDEE